jgi:hypothetical protein
MIIKAFHVLRNVKKELAGLSLEEDSHEKTWVRVIRTTATREVYSH